MKVYFIIGNYNEEIVNKEIKFDSHIFFITPDKKSGTLVVQWGTYFTDDRVLNLLDNYEFHGWSTERHDPISRPSVDYSSIEGTSALMYAYDSGSSRIKYTTNELLNRLDSLLEDGKYNLYTVWERKYTITFDATDEKYVNTFMISFFITCSL